MTTPTPTPPLTGRDINLAARATRLVLEADLVALDLTFEQWIVMNAIGGGTATDEPTVRTLLSSMLGLDDAAIDDLVDGLVAADVVDRGDTGGLAFTTAGTARFQAGEEVVAAIIRDLYAGIDPGELAAARRVLVEVTERAEGRLAA